MDLNVVKNLNQPMDLDAGLLIAEGYGMAVEAVAPKGGEALLEDILEPSWPGTMGASRPGCDGDGAC